MQVHCALQRTPKNLAIGRGKVDNLVSSSPSERALGRLGSVLKPDFVRRVSARLDNERTHFILLPGVIWPNIAPSSRIASYAVSVSSGLSVAVPKYNLPFDVASVCSLTVDVDAGLLAEDDAEDEVALEALEPEAVVVTWLCVAF